MGKYLTLVLSAVPQVSGVAKKTLNYN